MNIKPKKVSFNETLEIFTYKPLSKISGKKNIFKKIKMFIKKNYFND